MFTLGVLSSPPSHVSELTLNLSRLQAVWIGTVLYGLILLAIHYLSILQKQIVIILLNSQALKLKAVLNPIETLQLLFLDFKLPNKLFYLLLLLVLLFL